MDYKLSPSDLTFLYDGCKRCFVLKVKHGITQPSIPLPTVFSRIASLQKEYYSGKRTEDFCPSLPRGVVRYGEKRVRSKTLEIPGFASTCYISGRFDIVVEFDDHSFGVMDFKTGGPSDEKSEMYARQLHAYAIALENPDPGALQLGPVSRLGLLYFAPDRCDQLSIDRQILEGQLQWVKIERNDSTFMSFLGEVVRLLDGPLPEAQTDTCDWCLYLTRTRLLGTGQKSIGQSPVNKQATPTCPVCDGPMQLKTGKFGDFWSCLSYPSCKGTRKP